MGRPAKCRICGKRGNTDEMYKVVTGSTRKVNTYYCSEEEWQAEQERKRKFKMDKDKVYYLICDMFGYEIQNQKLFDEWALWNKLKSNAMIYRYIRENEDYLQEVCDRQYDNEHGRIMYFSAILKNKLHDFKPKAAEPVKREQKVVIDTSFELFEPTINVQTEKMILEDVEDDLI